MRLVSALIFSVDVYEIATDSRPASLPQDVHCRNRCPPKDEAVKLFSYQHPRSRCDVYCAGCQEECRQLRRFRRGRCKVVPATEVMSSVSRDAPPSEIHRYFGSPRRCTCCQVSSAGNNRRNTGVACGYTFMRQVRGVAAAEPHVSGPTLYDVLGIASTATPEQVVSGWRVTVKTVHPDVGGTDSQFRQARHAYRTLSDPVSRAAYDRTSAVNAAPNPFMFAPTGRPRPDTQPPAQAFVFDFASPAESPPIGWKIPAAISLLVGMLLVAMVAGLVIPVMFIAAVSATAAVLIRRRPNVEHSQPAPPEGE